MKKSVRMFWLSIVVLALGLPLLEIAWFAYVFHQPQPTLQADMLAVYGGDQGRYDMGWSTERRGHFKYLVFSDMSAEFVAQMEGIKGRPRFAQLLLEPKARATTQNARYVARLIVSHGCHSVLVVTSWWHLPRALLLTHLALLGRGVYITGLASDIPPDQIWENPSVWWELLRLWGSLATFESDTHRASAATPTYSLVSAWPRTRACLKPGFPDGQRPFGRAYA